MGHDIGHVQLGDIGLVVTEHGTGVAIGVILPRATSDPADVAVLQGDAPLDADTWQVDELLAELDVVLDV